MKFYKSYSLALSFLSASLVVHGKDWPTWVVILLAIRSPSRVKSLWILILAKWMTMKRSMSTTKNIKWVAKLGSQAYGNVTISNGRVFVGTNNESPRDEGKKGRSWCCRVEGKKQEIWYGNLLSLSLVPVKSVIGNTSVYALHPPLKEKEFGVVTNK